MKIQHDNDYQCQPLYITLYVEYHKGVFPNKTILKSTDKIICRSRRLRVAINLQDTDKSRHFAITDFNNCLDIRLPSLISYLHHCLTAQGNNLPFIIEDCGYHYM